MGRVLAALLVLLLCGGAAMAQDQTQPVDPVMGSPASPAAPAADTVYRILVMGDALGGGLGAGLMRYADANPGFAVSNRFAEDSGIARPEVYDWSETLPKILEGKSYDAIVVLLGSNDRQMIKSQNFRFGFNSPEWINAYKAQLARILEEMAVSGARVYWVSLPPMADADYDAAMQAISAIQKQEVEAHGMTFVDVRKAFLAADGSYTDTGPDDTGEIRKLRSRDGVTFFKQGNNRMAQLVMAAVTRDKDNALAGKSDKPAAEPAGPKPIDIAPVEVVPMFGQDDVQGVPVLVTPTEVAEDIAIASNRTYNFGNGSLKDLIRSAKPGSAAERLFAKGTAEAAPAGRADDFTLPAP